MSDATFCTKHGLRVGSVVTVYRWGDTYTIRITAIGESAILARRNGADESSGWDLVRTAVVGQQQQEQAK